MELHASLVCSDRGGLLIIGDSGTGKTSLALDLVSVGWKLVADDVVILENRGGRMIGAAPRRLRGLFATFRDGIAEILRLGDEMITESCEVGAAVHICNGLLPQSQEIQKKSSLMIVGLTIPLVRLPKWQQKSPTATDLSRVYPQYSMVQEQCFVMHDALLASTGQA